jgi:hypothetical protein
MKFLEKRKNTFAIFRPEIFTNFSDQKKGKLTEKALFASPMAGKQVLFNARIITNVQNSCIRGQIFSETLLSQVKCMVSTIGSWRCIFRFEGVWFDIGRITFQASGRHWRVVGGRRLQKP